MPSTSVAAFKKVITNPVKLKLFLFKNLPMAYLAGVRIKSLTEQEAQVTIEYGYLTKNPFKSIYFACLSMAAEMASGVLSMMYLYKAQPSVSMLVVSLEAEFTKKAVGTVTFTCADGAAIAQAVRQTQQTGQGTSVQALSIGRDEQGEEVARFRITWSFKARTPRT
ncbi:PaaI family thioesterase [Rufibacter immobilis]|uniref:PaaI family thioesterase n=1 Tax=Rufibacter immobilis TaxID=1348778 RepID=UPI0035E50B35